jgi:hypothetical protein
MYSLKILSDICVGECPKNYGRMRLGTDSIYGPSLPRRRMVSVPEAIS